MEETVYIGAPREICKPLSNMYFIKYTNYLTTPLFMNGKLGGNGKFWLRLVPQNVGNFFRLSYSLFLVFNSFFRRNYEIIYFYK